MNSWLKAARSIKSNDKGDVWNVRASRRPWIAGSDRARVRGQFKDVALAVEEGMKEKAEQFRQQGMEIHKPV